MNKNFGVVAHVESYGVTVTLYGTIDNIYVNARDVADWIDHRYGRSEVMLERACILPVRIEDEPYITLQDMMELVVPFFPRRNGGRFVNAILNHLSYLQERDKFEDMCDIKDRDVTYSMNDLTDIIWNRFSMGQNKTLHWLVNHGYVYHTSENKYMPYQRYIDKGWFVIVPKGDRSQTEVTYKGKEFIVNLLERY